MKKINANYFIRYIEVGDLLELFLVVAVVSMLAMRVFLHVFGYPQIASESLHIAHVLFGGFFMLVGLILALAFLNKEARYLGAVFGGGGFGLFIDELGKFITHDNNYFYQPTFALIYLIFVGLFYVIRALERITPPTSQEYIVNAMEFVKDAVVHDLDVDEQQRALELLSKARKNDPLVGYLTRMIGRIEALPTKPPNVWKRTALLLKGFYARLITNPYFSTGVIVYFGLMAFVSLGVSVFVVDRTGWWIWGLRISAVGVSVLVIGGTGFITRRMRLVGYGWYRQAVLVALLLFQFFLFYFHPLLAFAGLIVCLLTLLVLQYAINREIMDLQIMSKRRDPYRLIRWLVRRLVTRE